jgi:hypothetical protein
VSGSTCRDLRVLRVYRGPLVVDQWSPWTTLLVASSHTSRVSPDKPTSYQKHYIYKVYHIVCLPGSNSSVDNSGGGIASGVPGPPGPPGAPGGGSTSLNDIISLLQSKSDV